MALLAACAPGDQVGPWSPTEARINAAYPLAEPLRHNVELLRQAGAGEPGKDFAARLEARLKLRALNCAQDYSPSLFATAASIRKDLGRTSCFAEADAELTRWTGLLRAGIALALPPLKPVGKAPPATIVADGFISGAAFASAAPFVLLDVGPGQTLQVLDTETSKPVFREPAASAKIGQLSPNGRLFTVGDGERTRIRDTETGTVLVELPSVRSYTFHWLDARTAIFVRNAGGEKPFLIDFTSGAEVPVPWLSGGIQRASAVPGTPDQYVVLDGRSLTKVALQRGGVQPEVSLVAERAAPGVYWALNTSGLTADGTRFFGAHGGALRLVNLATLDLESVPFEPFTLQLALPTPDADKVLVTGYLQGGGGEGPRALLYSISRRTVAPIDTRQLASTRYAYVPPSNRQGLIADRRIELVDALPVQEEAPLERFAADLVNQANERKLAAFATQQALVGGTAPGAAGAPLADIGRTAQVEAIGVYQGATGTPQAGGMRRPGAVEVRLRRSARPLVLVLSSYEPVRWVLVPEPGAQLAAVLVSGYYPSQVAGAGSARVIMAGDAYAYKQDSGQYEALNRQVLRFVGKGIGLFQGRYEGSNFSVGGS
jgi:hypothetical protein